MPVNAEATGKTYPPFEYEVGKEKIREYAQAVGERRSRQGGTPGVENALTVATAVGLTFAAIIVAENSGNPNGDDDEPVSP